MQHENRRFSDEELRTAKETDLPELLASLGYTVKRIGSYYTTKEMDSLRIKDRRTWFRYSEQQGGDAIDFVERFCGKSFPEAVNFLLDYHGGARYPRAPPIVPPKEKKSNRFPQWRKRARLWQASWLVLPRILWFTDSSPDTKSSDGVVCIKWSVVLNAADHFIHVICAFFAI